MEKRNIFYGFRLETTPENDKITIILMNEEREMSIEITETMIIKPKKDSIFGHFNIEFISGENLVKLKLP